MTRYVEVPRTVLELKLQAMGFTRDDVRGEVVYSRRHHKHPGLVVKVYTSVGEFSDRARALGVDAIRVVGLLTWRRSAEDVDRRKTLYKAKILRVSSVDGVLERVHAKARAAYAALNAFAVLPPGGQTQARRVSRPAPVGHACDPEGDCCACPGCTAFSPCAACLADRRAS